VVENHAVPTVALQATILAGTLTVPQGKPALALLTANMLDRGTKTRDKRTTAEALDEVGAQLDSLGTFLDVTVTGTGLSRDTKLLLETLADQLKNPAFTPEEIERATSGPRSCATPRARRAGRSMASAILSIPRATPIARRAARTCWRASAH
jgi:predicted Zn-dependent peptidase